VRHAAAAGPAGASGWSDPPAAPTDPAVLARLRAALPPGAAVVSSDLERARQTAAALALPGPRLPDRPALRELHFGAWEGLGFAAIASADPVASGRFWARPGPVAAPEGESLDALMVRTAGLVAALNADPPAEDLVVIAHAGPIRCALALALGLPARAALACRIEPLSLSRLDWLDPPGAWAVDRVNHRP
jgi:broad specificity phosphatase PhoE